MNNNRHWSLLIVRTALVMWLLVCHLHCALASMRLASGPRGRTIFESARQNHSIRKSHYEDLSSTPSQLPVSIAAYLYFVHSIELRRIALASDTREANEMTTQAQMMRNDVQNNGTAQPSLGDAKGRTKVIISGMGDYLKKWNMLRRDFRTVAPPARCNHVAQDYYKFLSAYAEVMSSLLTALLTHDIHMAMELQHSQQQIDSLGRISNRDLATLCKSYNTSKPFNIRP
jgi:hypothetical protein